MYFTSMASVLYFKDRLIFFTKTAFLFDSIDLEKVRHVDHISDADSDNDKCKLLNYQIPSIEFSGGGTHTAEALLQAKVCFWRKGV